jgi:hypothetical protein
VLPVLPDDQIVLAKVANARSVLLRAARDCDPADAPRLATLQEATGRLAASVAELRQADTLDQVRGLEGEAASRYFGAFDALLSRSAAADSFRFTGRSRRPPLDRINALISFLYTLLLLRWTPLSRPIASDSSLLVQEWAGTEPAAVPPGEGGAAAGPIGASVVSGGWKTDLELPT